MVETEHIKIDYFASIVNTVKEIVEGKELVDLGKAIVAYENYSVDKAAIANFLIRARNPAFTRAVMKRTHWEDDGVIRIGYFQDEKDFDSYVIELELFGAPSNTETDDFNHILTLSTSGKNTIETYFDPYDEFGDIPVEERDATHDDISRFGEMMLGLRKALRS